VDTRTKRERLTLTVEEAAEALGIGRTLAYDAVRRGELPTVRLGRRLLVPQSALDRLLGIGPPIGASESVHRVGDQDGPRADPARAASTVTNLRRTT
jgi:excisionase family DNA binding protein